MPLTTRSKTQAGGSGGGVVKKPVRKGRAPSGRNEANRDHWTLSRRESALSEAAQSIDDDDDEQPLALTGPSDVEAAVNPLREMADKVGKEVELFATRLDQFLDELATHENKYEAARDLVNDLRRIANDAVGQRQKKLQRERAAQLRKEWSEQARLSTLASTSALSLARSSSIVDMSKDKAEELAQLRQYQQEVDMWKLFILCLDLEKLPIYCPAEYQQVKDKQHAELAEPHAYCSEAEIWKRFLVEDELAKERFMYKSWLEQTADHQENDLDGIVAELEAKSGAGQGLWQKGWMHTREKIKGEKRLRSLPRGSGGVQPHVRGTTTKGLLVTELDPDAPARQQRDLERPDAYFEKAVWITIWEMLRRGKSRKDIREWCEQRNEGWRSALLSSAPEGTDAVSNSTWRKMCYLASQSECSNDYEAAVYGLLGGNIKAAQKVCRTVHDHLFAHCATSLVLQFEAYLQHEFPDRVASMTGRLPPLHDIFNSDKAAEDIEALISQLQEGACANEKFKPLKIVEGYLFSRKIESLIYEVGYAASDLDKMRGGDEEMIERHPARGTEESTRHEADIVTDIHALRIVTHMYIIIRAMDKDYAEHVTAGAPDENVVAAYIQALRAVGLRDAALSYATQISRPRQDLTAAKVLQDVTQPREQRNMLELMKKFDLRLVPIIETQLSLVIRRELGDAEPVEKPLRILEDVEVGRLYPGQRIAQDFYPETMTESAVAVVNSLQWFRLLEGHWEVTFSSLSFALRKALSKLAYIHSSVHLLICPSYRSFCMRGRDRAGPPLHQNLQGEDFPALPPGDRLDGQGRALATGRRGGNRPV
jgi:nuclear pore complex protein Nup107